MSGLPILSSIAAVITLIAILYRPQVGIAAIVLFYPLWDSAPRLPVPGMNVETALLGLTLAMTFIRFGGRIPPPRYSFPVIAFVLVILASAAVSGTSIADALIGKGRWQIFLQAKSLAFTSLMFFFGYWWFPDSRDRRRLLEALSFGIGLAALATILDGVLGLSRNSLTGRASGFFQNPNGAGATLAPFMLVCLYLLRCRDLSRLRRQMHAVMYGLAWVAVIMTFSRTAWVAALVGHALWFFFVNRRILVLGAATTLLLGTAAFPLLPVKVQDRITMTTKASTNLVLIGTGNLEASTAFRVIINRVGLAMFLDSPLWGHGLESVYILTPHYGAKWGLNLHRDSHSLIIKFIAEMGLIGVGAMLWIVFTTVSIGRGLRRWSDQDPDLGSFVLASGATMLVGGLAQTSFLEVHAVSAYFWILFGLAGQFRYLGDEDEDVADLAPQFRGDSGADFEATGLIGEAGLAAGIESRPTWYA